MNGHPYHTVDIAQHPVALGKGWGHVGQTLPIGLVAGSASNLVLVAPLAVGTE